MPVPIKAGLVYKYEACFMDSIDPKTEAKDGDLVRIVNKPGCPKAGTMGHCHVETADDAKKFLGLVNVYSLKDA